MGASYQEGKTFAQDAQITNQTACQKSQMRQLINSVSLSGWNLHSRELKRSPGSIGQEQPFVRPIPDHDHLLEQVATKQDLDPWCHRLFLDDFQRKSAAGLGV